MSTNNKSNLSVSGTSWVLIFTILLGLLIISSNIHAQAISKKIAFTPELTDNYVVKEFSMKEVNNKLYFRFLILENNQDVNYTLESSLNGTDFYPVQLKQGFQSPTGVPLLYCFVVDLNVLNDNVYRIKRTSPEGEEFSSFIEVNDHDLVFSSGNKLNLQD